MFCFTISVFNLNPEYTVKKRDLFTNQTGMHNNNISLPKITLAVSESGCFEIWGGSGHLKYFVFIIYVSVLYRINVDLPRSCIESFTDASDKTNLILSFLTAKNGMRACMTKYWISSTFYFQIFPVLLSPHPAFFKSWMSVGSLVSRVFLSPIF